MLDLPAINTLTIDGIPVYWADGPPPLRASLAVRVGRADEPLHRSGITHLTEHLALWPLRQSAYSFNGATGLGRTYFYAAGSPAEIVEFLGSVASTLGALPVDRLEVERKVLLNEEQNRKTGVLDQHLNLRYGAQGFGKGAYREFALLGAPADEIQAWSHRWFTAQNAALWISGPPPADLRLPLRQGDRRLQPDPVPLADIQFPCLAALVGQGASVSMTTTRSVAASMVMRVAQRRATEKLRYDDGLVYAVNSSYEPISPHVALLGIWCEVPDDKTIEVAAALHQVLERLATDGPTEEELARCVDEAKRAMEQPEAILGMLNRALLDELDEQEFWSPARTVDEMGAVTREAAARALRDASVSALYIAPGSIDGPLADMARYPMFSRSAVAGSLLRHRQRKAFRQPPTMVAGEEGLTLAVAPGKDSTVRFSDVAVCLRHPGGRHLIGADAFRVVVNPTEWERGESLLPLVDHHVAPELMIDVDRSQPMPTAVNVPAGAAPQRPPMSASRRLTTVLVVVAVFGALTSMLTRDTPGGGVSIGSTLCLIFAMITVRVIYSLIRG